MKIDIDHEQGRQIALAYIRENHDDEKAMKEVVLAVFSGCHFAPWSWDTLLKQAATFCSKVYHIPLETITEGWKP